MPLISTSTTLKDRSCEVKISTLHNKKLQASVCHIEFDTSETSLLGLLLSRYAREKCIECGVNTASQIYSCIPGKSGIVVVCPENKLTQNITLLYAYLQKTKLSSAQAKFCIDGNYKKLSGDIKKFEVSITGKCKSFTAALENKAPKIERMIKSISAVEPNTSRESCGNSGIEQCSIEFEGGDDIATTMLYTSIFMGNTPCVIGKSGNNVKVTLIGASNPCELQRYFHLS